MEDVIYLIIQGLLLALVGFLGLASLVALWTNPGLWTLGAISGGLVMGLVWAVLGAVIMAAFGSEGEQHSFWESVSPAWPLFLKVLFWSVGIGAGLGGFGVSFLYGRLPWEDRDAETGSKKSRWRRLKREKSDAAA